MKLAAGLAVIVCAALGAGCDLSPQPLPPQNSAASSGSLASSGTSSLPASGAASGAQGPAGEADAAGQGPSGTAAPVGVGDAALELTITDGGGPEITDASSDSTSLLADAGLDADRPDLLEAAGASADARFE
jgi:hypothetical protein